MRKINTKTTEGVWVKYPEDQDIQFLIRPFSIFNLQRMPSAENADFTIDEYWTIFNYCLVDWKGIYDENDKPLKCNEQNKKLIADHIQDLATFVIEEAVKAKGNVSEKAVKN